MCTNLSPAPGHDFAQRTCGSLSVAIQMLLQTNRVFVAEKDNSAAEMESFRPKYMKSTG